MELTFPIAALIVLCFVFVAGNVLITHQCSGYCRAVLTQHQGRLSTLPHQKPIGWEWARGWRGRSWDS